MVNVDAILEPVADAVSQLVIYSATSEQDDVEMPDLVPLSEMVTAATNNLVTVASQMASQSTDAELKAQLPPACDAISVASGNLFQACSDLRAAPRDAPSRNAMVRSCKGILQGMTELLEVVDRAEIRRILKYCQKSATVAKVMTQVSTTSDLVQTAQTLSNATTALVRHTQTRVAEMTHVELKERLQKAVDGVRRNSPLLISATRTVISVDGQAAAVQSQNITVSDLAADIQEIATVVQMDPRTVPSAYNNDVGQSAAALRNIIDDMNRMYAAAQAGDRAGYDQASAQLINDVRNLLDDTRALAAKVSDPILQKELLAACDRLEALTPELIAAAQAVLDNPDDVDAQRRLNDVMGRTRKAMAVLERARADALEEEANRLIAGIPPRLAETIAAAEAGDQPNFVANAKMLGNDSAALVDIAREIAAATQDPLQRRQIEAAAADVEKGLPAVIHAGKTLLLNPDDDAAREHLHAVSNVWRDNVDTLANALQTHRNPETEIRDLVPRIEADLSRLAAAAAIGDVQGAADLAQSSTDKLQALVDYARQVAAGMGDDPERQAAIYAACDEIEALIPQIKAAAAYAAQNPDDPEAQARLAELINRANAAANLIHAAINGDPLPTKEQEISAINIQAPTLMASLMDAIKAGDEDRARILLGDILGKYNRLLDLAREIAANETDPAKKAAILEGCDKLENLLNELQDAVKAALANPNDLEAQQRVQDLINEIQETGLVIEKAIAGDFLVPLPEPEPEEEEWEEEPLDLSEDPLMAAAQKVQHAAGRWETEGNEMVTLAGEIGDLMAALSAAAAAGDKRALIEAARAIANEVKRIAKMAKEIAANCTDPRLKHNLLTVVEMVPNMAVQLKILCAVKASSDDVDPDTINQLVTCAQGLSDAVVKTVSASQAASITSVRTAAAVVNVALKWKRKALKK